MGSVDQSARRFAETWRRIERGEKVHSRALLRFLRRSGPMSIRALAKSLARDYKNVYTDVKEMEGVGLVSKVENGKVKVPWDTVVAEVSLEAA